MSKFIRDVKKKNTVGGGNKIIGVEMDFVAGKNEHFCTEKKPNNGRTTWIIQRNKND